MNTRFLLIIGCGMAGAGVGAAYKAWRDPSWVASGREGAMNFSETTLVPTTAATSQSPQARANPVVPPLPRPSLDDVKATAPDDRMRLLVRWLPEATADEVAALAEAWFTTMADSGTTEWQALCARWVELEPAAARAFGKQYTERFLKLFGPGSEVDGSLTVPLHAVYLAWGRVDPEAALAALAQEAPEYRRQLMMILNAMVGEERARAWALAHPELPEFANWRIAKPTGPPDLSNPANAAADLAPEASRFHASAIANAWAKQDPDAALAWARGLINPQQRTFALQAVLNVFLGTDPARARPLIDELPPGLARAQVEARYAAGLAENDPQAALRHAMQHLHGTARLEAIAGIAALQSKTDPLGALRLLQEHGIGALDRGGLYRVHVDGPGSSSSGSSGTNPLNDVLRAAAPIDPAGVMHLLAESGYITLEASDRGIDDGQGTLARTLFAEWAARDLAAAIHWLYQQPDKPGTAALLKGVTDRWPLSDVAGLQQFAAQLPAGAARDQAVAEAARRIVGQDAAGALAWAAQTGGEPALASAFRHLAETDAPAAINHFHESLSPEMQAGQRQLLTDQLARRSPAEAIGFYEALPPEQQTGVKLYDTSMAYARLDPQAASEWITSLPATEAKDTAISGLVDYLITESSEPDPLAAAHWAAASIDPAGRDRRVQRVAEAWFQRDPQGAPAAIAGSGLPSEIKQSLLDHAPSPR